MVDTSVISVFETSVISVFEADRSLWKNSAVRAKKKEKKKKKKKKGSVRPGHTHRVSETHFIVLPCGGEFRKISRRRRDSNLRLLLVGTL
ncbi:hypothetical protein CBR_g9044 [Chara braunii]|uniref:Uncharacterized protein n=1 Tax=Chara braunii TaxID=69332 RepID=A0A388KNP4_CHABU|nr:hypothetical protein CBR_g9044 [Chara braunii]|eukprot:GBG71628.1 hypothetical protein CBR_g9044 [Chara braunii]